MLKAALFAAVCLTALPAAAQTPVSGAVAITNVRIETATDRGAITSGTVLVRDGKIAAVGADVAVPADARVIDAKGGVVTPGFIAPSTNLTLAEVEAVRQTRDDRSGERLSAGFDVQYGVNPNSTVIPLARQTGVTRAVATPVLGKGWGGGHKDDSGADEHAEQYTAGGGGIDEQPALFAGQAAIVRLADGDPDPVLKAKVAVALDLGDAGAANAGGGSRGSTFVLLRAALEDAADYAKNRKAYDAGQLRALGLSRIDLDALVPVVQGKTPLLVRVHRASDIRNAIKFARDMKLKIILEGAEEGWMVAGDLAAAGVPVLIDAQADLPDQFETLGARLDNAAKLQAAGVAVAIMGPRDFNNLRQARLNAGLAVANGLPYDAAIRSLTSVPAKIWGMDDAGVIEAGKTADLVVWTGDPLETTSWPAAIFVAGREQPNTSRGLKLRDRYAPAQGAYPRAYSK